jgi:hypothetical protein
MRLGNATVIRFYASTISGEPRYSKPNRTRLIEPYAN